ncbi:MAG: hypothetical protein ACEQSA_04735 [Weeksellaceae bacterium]
MNKETIFAIGFGILLGAVVGIVMLFQSNKAEQTKVIPVAPDSQAKQVVQKSTSNETSPLTIVQPVQSQVVNVDEIVIKGKAQANSLIVVQSPVATQVVKSKTADFSVTMSLALGENTISISAYGANSTPQEQTLQVYYIEE